MCKNCMEIITLAVAIIAASATIWAAIATYLAAKAARDSADISAKQFQNQVNEQAKIERPRLVPLNQKVSTTVVQALSDWTNPSSDSEKILNGKEGFSEYTIPLINAGNSFAIDIKYCFEIEGGMKAIKELVYENISIYKPTLIEGSNHEEVFRFTVAERTNILTSQGALANVFEAEVIPFFRSISIIQSNDTNEISIPSYFVVLSNIYLMNHLVKRESQLLRPILRLSISYKDQYNNEHIDTYRMQLVDKHIALKGSKIETWIDFEIIDPNDK